VKFSGDVAVTARVYRLTEPGLPAVVLLQFVERGDDERAPTTQGSISITAEEAVALAAELQYAAGEAQSMNASLMARLAKSRGMRLFRP